MSSGSVTEPSGTADFALPIGPTRSVVGRGTILSLRDGSGCPWSLSVGTGKVVGGALLFDGRLVAIHVAGARGRDLILVVAVRDGTIERRVLVDNARVHFAPRRGLAVAHIAKERLLVIDLRLGWVIANRSIDATVAEIRVETGGAIELLDAVRGPTRFELVAPHNEPDMDTE